MKKFFRILVPVLMAALIIASIGWYLFVYDRDFTRDMLLAQARYQDLHGNARLSAWFYDLAYEHSGRDENVAIELANQYKSDDNYTKAEATLSKALYTTPTTELYIALCKTYVEQDKLMDAVALLESIQDPAIRASIETLRPAAPTADYEPGFYSKYLSVSLVSQSGTVYCTTDGEYPSVADAPYSAPISLPAGETVIQAICVDDTGLVSPLTVLGYTVGGVIEPAVFMDSAIEASVRELLDIGEGKVLYTDALWGVTEFTVPTNAASLDDLALMPYLVSLTAADLQLDNLDGLSSLAKLVLAPEVTNRGSVGLYFLVTLLAAFNMVQICFPDMMFRLSLWGYVRNFGDTEFGGKTGTSNNHSDAWFVGVSPKLVVGAWVGGEYRCIHFRTGALGQGSRTALPICGYFLESVLSDPAFAQYRAKFDKPNDDTITSDMYTCQSYYHSAVADTTEKDSAIVTTEEIILDENGNPIARPVRQEPAQDAQQGGGEQKSENKSQRKEQVVNFDDL